MKSTCKETCYRRGAQDNDLCYQTQQCHVQPTTGQSLGLFCNQFSPCLSNPSLSSLLPFGHLMILLGFSFLMLYSLKPLRTSTTEEKEPSHLQKGSFFCLLQGNFFKRPQILWAIRPHSAGSNTRKQDLFLSRAVQNPKVNFLSYLSWIKPTGQRGRYHL